MDDNRIIPTDYPYDDKEVAGETREQPDVPMTIAALKAGEKSGALNSTIDYGLSGLDSAQIAQIKPVWGLLNPAYRRKVMRHLADIGEVNFDLHYDALAIVALNDADPDVRSAAIDVLFEDESIEVMRRLVALARTDESRDVRASAASALGRYILAGELEEMPPRVVREAQQAALELWRNTDENIDVRRRALEALSNSTHDIVPSAILQAYGDGDRRLRVSAVFAMGRSCDDRWAGEVLQELDSEDPEMRFEAARAAGEIEIAAAVPQLRMLVSNDDRETSDMAIWALGEIGGEKAIKVLERLAHEARKDGNDDRLEAIEDAISTASLAGDMAMLDFEEDPRG